MNLKFAKINLKQKLNKRETIIFMATILMACLGYFKACIIPAQKKLTDTKQQIYSLENERIGLKAQIAAAKNQEKAIVTKQKQWLGTRNFLPQTIDAMAQPIHLRGIKILGVELIESQKKEKKSTLKKDVTLTLSGNFMALGPYIEFLENLPVPLVIESFSIATDGNKPSQVIVKIQGGFYVSK